MIKINGVALPISSDYTVSIMDISKANRTAAGTMIIDRIATKRKIELNWKHLSKEELAFVLSKVSDVFFTVEYIDPETNSNKTGTFYCGNRSCGAMDYIDGNIRWKDIRFNLIER